MEWNNSHDNPPKVESEGTLVPHHYEVVNMVLVEDVPQSSVMDETIINFWENLDFNKLKEVA